MSQATPPLRTAGGGSRNQAELFYAKRVRARSARVPKTLNIPATFGVPTRPAREDKFSTRLDVLGPLIAGHYPVVPDGSRANLLAAFDKRCNYYSDLRVDRSIIKASVDLLNAIAPNDWDPIDWTPELFHKWNSQFSPDKQARHLRVLPRLSEATSKEFSAKEIFVKAEALLKRHDPNWAPRIINKSSDLHNCLLGPVMQKCTQRMFSAFELDAPEANVRFMGAYKKSSEQLASRVARFSTPHTVFVESDFSSNDMKQVRDVHLLEVKWLRRFGAPLWLTGLMLHANSFVVSSRAHAVKAQVKHQLATGAQSTTFRNSLWNASICYAFCQRVKAKGDVLILGDDMLMRLDNPFSTRSKNIRREYEHVAKMACMDAEVVVRKHLSECSFLSKHFIMVTDGFVMAPKLGKAIARFNARASVNEAVSDQAYLAGKALSYAFEFRHLPPISRAFLLRYEQLAPDGRVSLDGLGWNAKGEFLSRGVHGVLAAIKSCRRVATRDDMTRFYHYKYSKTFMDIMELVMAALFSEEDLDVVGVGRILEDFVE